MAFELEWTGPARHEISEILARIAADNSPAVETFYAGLLRRVSRLVGFPRSGALYRRRRGYEVRQITYGNFRIFYRVRPRLGRVQILSIYHGARQEPRLP